jgi:hypothetical protein
MVGGLAAGIGGGLGTGGGSACTVDAIGIVSIVPHLGHLPFFPALSMPTFNTWWHE